ncbi:MAG: helix-turn-helix transcriptional regulator [Firmicutes bacterium]|nr:helix-turn-helix transcriptional regulator [Bacillota bacterium]
MVEYLGPRIRARRVALGLTQQGLADLVGYTKSMISQTERGGVWPSIDPLLAIARALGMPAGYFTGP